MRALRFSDESRRENSFLEREVGRTGGTATEIRRLTGGFADARL